MFGKIKSKLKALEARVKIIENRYQDSQCSVGRHLPGELKFKGLATMVHVCPHCLFILENRGSVFNVEDGMVGVDMSSNTFPEREFVTSIEKFRKKEFPTKEELIHDVTCGYEMKMGKSHDDVYAILQSLLDCLPEPHESDHFIDSHHYKQLLSYRDAERR